MHRRPHAHGQHLGRLERSRDDRPHVLAHRPGDLGRQAYRATRTASLAAESGHAKGTVNREGALLGIDVEGVANGSNQTVFITTPDGGTAEVITVGDGYWVGGDEGYWAETTGDPANAATLVGKYAPITESDATELGSFTLRTLLTNIFSMPEFTVLESDTGEATRTEVDGQQAFVPAQGGPRLWVELHWQRHAAAVVGPADRRAPTSPSTDGTEPARSPSRQPAHLHEN